jgi:hypothetical protein
MDANGASPTRLTNSAGLDGLAAWSPDNTKIAFMSARDGNQEIYSMNANGTSQTRLTNSPDLDDDPDWSPDNTKIAFGKVSGGSNLVCSINAGGGGQICSSFTALDEPAWSPDNSQIAVTGCCDYEIFTGTPTGTPTAQLTDNTANDQGPDWQPVVRNFARPQAANTLRLALVPAYKQCTSINTRHRGALTTQSCAPPVPESSYLTMGTPDFNGAPSKASGVVRVDVFCNGGATGEQPPCLTTPGDQLDAKLTVSQTDVRCQAAGTGCTGALSDYSGSLEAEITNIRVTDKNSFGAGSATLQDILLRFPVPCTSTGDTTVGSTCSASTSIDAVLAGNDVVSEQKRAIWHLPDVKLYDGGIDAIGNTVGDNTLYEWSGVFFP